MSAIKAGDLVMVVRPTLCCGHPGQIGTVFVAESVEMACGESECCGDPTPIMCASIDSEYGYDLRGLIRIDPPALPESVETDREVVA